MIFRRTTAEHVDYRMVQCIHALVLLLFPDNAFVQHLILGIFKWSSYVLIFKTVYIVWKSCDFLTGTTWAVFCDHDWEITLYNLMLRSCWFHPVKRNTVDIRCCCRSSVVQRAGHHRYIIFIVIHYRLRRYRHRHYYNIIGGLNIIRYFKCVCFINFDVYNIIMLWAAIIPLLLYTYVYTYIAAGSRGQGRFTVWVHTKRLGGGGEKEDITFHHGTIYTIIIIYRII